MKKSGIAAAIIESCDSALIRKALNVGLPMVVCTGVCAIEQGEELELDLATGLVRNVWSGAARQARPFSDRMIEVWQAGSLTRAMRRRLRGARG
jgi:3-isopropylmalate/(R)-2-methylmalate dehydratase small subunit